MTAKRFMVDDAGTLIDMHTRDTFDYVSDVCDLLNEQHEENIELHIQNDFLKDENQHMRDLVNENKQLKEQLHYCKSFVVNNNGKDVQRIFFKSLEELE